MSTQAKFALVGAMIALFAGPVAWLYLAHGWRGTLDAGSVLLASFAVAAASVLRGGRCGWRCQRRVRSGPDSA